jgi:hypothetical protein
MRMGKPGQYGRKFGYKESEFGSDSNGHSVTAYGNSTGKSIQWDAATGRFYINGDMYLGGTGIFATANEINRVCDVSLRVISITAAAIALTEGTHDGKVITLNRAAGIAVTLPAAIGSGASFKLFVGTTITSGSITVKVVGNDTMIGNAVICNDTDATVSGFETAADSDTITFNGSTTGGIKGDSIELIDIATDTWWVRINGSSTGAEATPFSATVA